MPGEKGAWSIESHPIDEQFGKRVKLSVESADQEILIAALYDQDPDYVREDYGRKPTAVSDF